MQINAKGYLVIPYVYAVDNDLLDVCFMHSVLIDLSEPRRNSLEDRDTKRFFVEIRIDDKDYGSDGKCSVLVVDVSIHDYVNYDNNEVFKSAQGTTVLRAGISEAMFNLRVKSLLAKLYSIACESGY